MKKLVALSLLSLILALSACGTKNDVVVPDTPEATPLNPDEALGNEADQGANAQTDNPPGVLNDDETPGQIQVIGVDDEGNPTTSQMEEVAPLDLTTEANQDQANGDLVPESAKQDYADTTIYPVVYFAFDSDFIEDKYAYTIRHHAEYLKSHPQAILILEGNTDERGSRIYNLNLGERRALAVKKALLLYGVNEKQIETISYGEENPAVEPANDQDEEAFALNRRVEFKYKEAP